MQGGSRLRTPSSMPIMLLIGSWVASTGASTATNSSVPRIIRPATAERWWNRCRNVSRHRLLGACSRAGRVVGTASAACIRSSHSTQTNAGIKVSVRQIDNQVDNDEADGDDQRKRLHDGVIARGDGIEQAFADAGQAKHGLGQYRAAQQRAELQADDGNHRQQRVAHGVTEYNQTLLQPFGP